MKNKVRCAMYFGAPGSGKTTLAVAEARKAMKKGITVYTNFPCSDAYKVDSKLIGKYALRNALVIIDEAGLDFNNRNYASFSKEMTSYIKYHRHYRTTFLFLSQGWDDCDKKIRTVCQEYWVVHKIGPITWRRLLAKKVGINDVDKQIIDQYFKFPMLRGGIKFCWRPRWYRYYDSWLAPALPDYPRELW